MTKGARWVFMLATTAIWFAGCGTRTSVGGVADGGSPGGPDGAASDRTAPPPPDMAGTDGGARDMAAVVETGGVTGSGGSAVGGQGGVAASGGAGGALGCVVQTAPPLTLAFGDLRTFLVEPHPFSIAMADVTGDGMADLVVANNLADNTSVADVLVNDGNGYFTLRRVVVPLGGPVNGLALEDLNGDGKIDLVASGYLPSDVRVLLGHGDGSFAPPKSYGAGVFSLGMGDMNGDGRVDLVVSKFVGDAAGEVTLLVNDGPSGNFFESSFPLGATPGNPLVLADFNRDGRLDVAVSVGDGVRVLLNQGGGSLASPLRFAGGTSPFALVPADFDGDCAPDLGLVSGLQAMTVSVLFNDGKGRFAAPVNYRTTAVSTYPSVIAAADMNGDGKADLVMTIPHPANGEENRGGGVSVLLNQGHDVFGSPLDYPDGAGLPNSLAIGDLDGDGKPDVAVAYDNGVSVLVNRSHP